MKNGNTKKLVYLVVPVLIALISIFVVARFAGSAEFYAKTIASLDDKMATVMELTAASTAASAAITLIPGDTATPIAEKLADFSTYFLVVLCAIYLEKYLLTVTGTLAFIVLIPAACALCVADYFLDKAFLRRLALRLTVFGLAIVLVTPASVWVSGRIEDTYHTSLTATLENAQQTTEEIAGTAEEESEGGDTGLISGLLSTVQEGVTGVTDKVKSVLNDYIEALAVLLVTSCVIPILVMLFFIWLVKMTLGLNYELPGAGAPRRLRGQNG